MDGVRGRGQWIHACDDCDIQGARGTWFDDAATRWEFVGGAFVLPAANAHFSAISTGRRKLTSEAAVWLRVPDDDEGRAVVYDEVDGARDWVRLRDTLRGEEFLLRQGSSRLFRSGRVGVPWMEGVWLHDFQDLHDDHEA
jgi:hypothetical protein